MERPFPQKVYRVSAVSWIRVRQEETSLVELVHVLNVIV